MIETCGTDLWQLIYKAEGKTKDGEYFMKSTEIMVLHGGKFLVQTSNKQGNQITDCMCEISNLPVGLTIDDNGKINVIE